MEPPHEERGQLGQEVCQTLGVSTKISRVVVGLCGLEQLVQVPLGVTLGAQRGHDPLGDGHQIHRINPLAQEPAGTVLVQGDYYRVSLSKLNLLQHFKVKSILMRTSLKGILLAIFYG